MFESWGKSKQEVPQNNDIFKREILSKVPDEQVKIKTPYYSKNGLPWLSMAFTAIAMVILFVDYGSNFSGNSYTTVDTPILTEQAETLDYAVPPTTETRNLTDKSEDTFAQNESRKMSQPTYGVSSASSKSIVAPDFSQKVEYRPQPMPQQSSPISDNREFLKINYNSTAKTRDVIELTNSIETIVRGHDGRIDSSNSSEKYGYVSFAIPKNQFPAFREEVKNLVGSKFYIEQTSSQNLLSQKQNLEQNQNQIQKNISDLNSERSQIVKIHNQNISLYQTRINSINSEVSTLTLEYKTASTTRQTEILRKINQLQTEIGNIESEIQNENSNYQYKINNVDTQIRYSKEISGSIQKQDNSLIEDVNTVTGTVSISHIGLWEMLDTYTPGPLLGWILIICAVASLVWWRRRKIEWEM